MSVFLPGIPWHRARVGRLALDLAACLILSAVMIASALAQGTLPQLELNKLEPQGENCRAWFLVETDGMAQKRFALDAGPVADVK